MYGGISKLYIIQILIYIFFRFNDKVLKMKTEQYDVATYGGISKLYIIQIRIIYSFVSLAKYAGRKLNNLMWLRMAWEFMSIYFCRYGLRSQLWLRMTEYLKYISSRYVLISSFVSLKKYAGQKLNNLMWLRMAGEFMSIYFCGYSYLANVSSLACGQ